MKVFQRFKGSSVNCVVQMTGQGVSRAMSSSLYAINRPEITSQLYKVCLHIVPCHLMKDSNVIDKDGHSNYNPSYHDDAKKYSYICMLTQFVS